MPKKAVIAMREFLQFLPHTHTHTHTHTHIMHTVSGWAVGIGMVIAVGAMIITVLLYLMPDDFPRLLIDWLTMLAGGATWWD